MSRYPYLLNRNGNYHCRIAVPLALVPQWGRKQLWCSLKTKDLSEARLRCLVVLEAVQRLFQESLSGGDPVTKTRLNACLSQFSSRKGHNQSGLADVNTPVPNSENGYPIGQEGEKLLSAVYEIYLSECTDRPPVGYEE